MDSSVHNGREVGSMSYKESGSFKNAQGNVSSKQDKTKDSSI